MKIAFINYYQNSVARGSETFIKELTRRLSANHEVKIFSGQGRIIKRWPLIWRTFLDPQGLVILWFTVKLLPKLWRGRYDVIFPLNSGWQAAIIRIFTLFSGARMVVTGHSGIGWDDFNNLWCFPNTFVALSKSALKWAKWVNPWVKSIYIPNGIDLNRFNSQGQKMSIGLPKPVILTVGSLTPDKRIDLTIKAVANLKTVSLLVVGDGILKNKLQAFGANLLGSRFKLIQLPYEQMPEAYRAANLFTSASTSGHSFEIVLLEAMASGLGVVANHDPIRTGIIGEAGYLVNPQDLLSYAATLQKALDTNWGDKPQKQAAKFNWDKIAKQYENLCNNTSL